ncbi:hypothetical protein GB937_005305 [Aspergillus fischeri]|nr:hypothetical protein GB937_005305 [Aspergillus fischeri]
MQILESLGYQNGSRLPSLKRKIEDDEIRKEKIKKIWLEGGSTAFLDLILRRDQERGEQSGQKHENDRPSVRPAWSPAASNCLTGTIEADDSILQEEGGDFGCSWRSAKW